MRLYAHDSSLLCSPSLWQAPETLAQIGALLAPLQLSVGHLALYPARSGRPAGAVYQTELAALHRRFQLDQAERCHATRRELPQTRSPTLVDSGSELLLLPGPTLSACTGSGLSVRQHLPSAWTTARQREAARA